MSPIRHFLTLTSGGPPPTIFLLAPCYFCLQLNSSSGPPTPEQAHPCLRSPPRELFTPNVCMTLVSLHTPHSLHTPPWQRSCPRSLSPFPALSASMYSALLHRHLLIIWFTSCVLTGVSIPHGQGFLSVLFTAVILVFRIIFST